MRKNSFFWIVIAILFSIVLDNRANSEKLKLDISLSKENYFVMEPIWLDITLTNVSLDTIRTLEPCLECYYTKFQIISQEGDTLKYQGARWHLVRLPGQLIGKLMPPGDSEYDCFNVLEYYGDITAGIVSPASSRFKLKPGKYSIRTDHLEKIISPTLYFEVKELTDTTEIQALDLLDKGYFAMYTRNSDSALVYFQQLIRQFPKSIYVESAYKELATNDSLKMEMLRKFPDSGYLGRIIEWLLSDKNLVEQVKLLQQITQDYSGTRSAKFAEKLLKILSQSYGLK